MCFGAKLAGCFQWLAWWTSLTCFWHVHPSKKDRWKKVIQVVQTKHSLIEPVINLGHNPLNSLVAGKK